VRLTQWLGQHHFGSQYQVAHGEVLLCAHRNRWASPATLFTHLAILLLLVGALMSTALGWERDVQIPYGETLAIDRAQPVGLRNEGFRIERHADGSPAMYEAQLAVIDGEREPQRVVLRVNQPLRYRGYSVYLSSYWGQPNQYGVVLLVARNPGYLPFILGGILMVISITLSLYWPHSRIAARISPDGGIALAGWPALYDTQLYRGWPDLIEALEQAERQDQTASDLAKEGAQ
jgi:cytochrome c biogenesis protein ResB